MLLNNKSNYHEGSKLVWDNLVYLANKYKVGKNKAIINGEGTTHNDTFRCKYLLEKGKLLNELGYKVYLINCVWQNNNYCRKYIKYFERIFVRESLSSEELGEKAEICPDLSLYLREKPIEQEKKFKLIVIDSVVPHIANELVEISKSKNVSYLKMCERNDVERAISQSKKVITGRFHGITLCIKHGIPFEAYKSNTHKVEGILKDINGDQDKYLIESQDKIKNMFKEIAND